MPMQDFLANILAKMMEERKRRIEVEPLQQNGGADWFSDSPVGQFLGDTSEPSAKWFADSPVGQSLYDERLPQTAAPSPDISVEQLKMAAQSPRDEPGISEQVYAPEPPLSAPEDDPGEYLRNYASNMDPDKLAKIRAQAYLKGQAGRLDEPTTTLQDYKAMLGGKSSRGGGSFSQQDESPELAMRLSERDNWAAGQDVRDAKWDVDLARMHKDPAAQESAGNRLVSLKNQESADRRNKMLELIVQKVGKNGKIPYKEATTLRQLGLPIDLTMMGSDPDTVSQYFQGLQAAGGEFLSQLDPISIMEDPGLMKRADVEKKLMMLAAEYDKKLKAGYDPDEARREYERAGHNFIIANGLGNLLQIRNGQLTEASK